MEIAIVNTYANIGGAAKAAQRLHDGLNQIGHKSTMYVAHGNGNNVVEYQSSGSVLSRLKKNFRARMIRRSLSKYIQTRPQGLDMFTDDRTSYGHSSITDIRKFDLINFHWVAGFINYASIPELSHIPIVWTLHDMNPFTGGCHYDDGCGKYTQACGSCPQLGSKISYDLSAKIWKRKKAAFAQLNPDKFHVVTPSKWLADEASRSTLLKRFRYTIIPNGLDTSLFAPRGTSDLKQTLNIPLDARIILFLADSVENKRKGLYFLFKAISSMHDQRRVVLLSVGSRGNSIPTSFRHIHIDRVEDERILSMIYSLADVFALPSLQDNLPNTVMESLACGTPVIAFNIGGVPDMVTDGETGFLVPAGDVAGIKAAIEEIIGNGMLCETMSRHCRAIAVKEYDVHMQAKRYGDLYKLLSNKK